MNIKSICFVTDAFISDPKATITGPMVQTYLLGKEFRRRGWSVNFISYSKGEKKYREEFEELTVYWLPYRTFFSLFMLFRVYRLLKKIKPAYCYQRGRDPLTGIAAYFCRYHSGKFIWASAGESGVSRKKYLTGLSAKKKSLIKKILLFPLAVLQDMITEYGVRNADQIIVQTSYQQISLKNEFKRSGIIIKSGHPVPEAEPRPLPWKILWIGSIKPVKQPELFLELAERCIGLNCEFIMAGQIINMIYGKNILTKIETMPNLHYAGVIPFQQSGTFIAKAHAVVNTTKKDYEGLPNAFVQAWLAGTITISLETDPDGVIRKHSLGLHAGSVDRMEDFIRDWTHNPALWEKMSHTASQFAKDNFSIESVTGQLISAIGAEIQEV